MERLAIGVVLFCFVLAPGIADAGAEKYYDQKFSPELNLSTPEATWQVFVNAIAAGDYELAKKCCCPEERKAVKWYRHLGPDKAGKVLNTVQNIERVYQKADTAKYMVHRDINGTKLTTYVYFAKADGRWTIARY